MPRRRKKPQPAPDPTAVASATECTIATTDLDGHLASLAGRLRVHAWALRGIAGDEPAGVGGEPDADPRRAMADELEAAARAVLAVAAALCPACRVRDVTAAVRIGGAAARRRG